MELRIAPDQWESALGDTDGPQLVVAGPGAGKTEFLIRRALTLIERGVPAEAVLMLTFSRRGAADTSARLQRALGSSAGRVGAITFHTFAWRVLEAHAPQTLGWDDMPALLTGPEQVSFVADLLAAEAPAAWPLAFRGMLRTRTFAREVTDFLLRAAEQLLGPAELAERAAGRDDWRALPQFAATYRERLGDEGRVDYGTVQAMAVELLGRPEVAAAIGRQFSHVLCDEYQDTTHAQAVLLRRLYEAGGNLTVAGDPYQSVYSFRGAELRNIEQFPSQFPQPDGMPAKRLVLTTSFRVPEAIMDAAVSLTRGQELPGGAGPVIPAPGTGAVDAHRFDQQTEEAEWIAAEVERLHLLEDIPLSAMAVLVRSKRRLLPELSRALDRRHIPHDRPDRRLADQPAVRMVAALCHAAMGRDVDASLRLILLGPWFHRPWGKVRYLEEQLALGRSWLELLRDEFPELASLLSEPDWATGRPAVEGLWHLWTGLPQAADLANRAEHEPDRRAFASLFQVATRLGERDPTASLAAYVRLLEDEEFEATPLLAYEAPDVDRLVLTTLHQAKGSEFDVVFIADATEGTFPDLRRRDSLLGSRELSGTQPSDPAEYVRFRLQEETRLAYTAMTRARRRVVWTTTATGYDEGEGIPSRFLDRIAAVTKEVLAGPPATDRAIGPRDAESRLRRLLRDPSSGTARRLAAAAALAYGPAFGLRPIGSYAGVRPVGGGTKAPPPPSRLSPTAAEAYLDCPRRYFLETKVAARTANIYAKFGSALHSLLAEVEERARARGETRGDVTEAVALVDRYVTDNDFGGPVIGPWWRRRAVATLQHLYEHMPPSQEIVAVEHPVELDLHGISWRGRVDRIERLAGGGLRIVDYKTSKSLPLIREVEASLQLAFYVEAVERDPALDGEVVAAELWFPGVEQKALARRSFDLRQRQDLVAQLEEVVVGMSDHSWPARPGSMCDRCPMKGVCPAWPEGREAFAQ